MSQRITCPKCSARLKVDDDLDPDDRIECTRCGKRFLPPEEEVTHRGKKVRRASSCGGVAGCLLLVLVCAGAFGIFQGEFRKKALEDIAAGDQLHASGKKGEAAARYKAGYTFAPEDRKPEIIKRIVEWEVEAGNEKEARDWIEKGLTAKMNVTYEPGPAKELAARIQRERAEAEAQKQAEIAKRKASQEADDRVKKEERDKKSRYGTYVEAMVNAEKAIRKNLPYPNDATFHALGRPVIQNPDGSWQVSGSVDTRDSFGKRITYQFNGAMLRAADGSWGSVGNILLDPE